MIRNKKIFHFANNDYDGAGIQVLNNHKYLIKNNFVSKVFLIDKKNNTIDSTSIPLILRLKLKIVFVNFLKNFNFIKILLISKNPISISFNNIKYDKKFLDNFIFKTNDIFIFYGFNKVVDIKFLEIISKANIYFFPLDMETLTGGCHFDLNCISSLNNFENISLRKKTYIKNKISSNYDLKKKIFSKLNPKFIASNKGVLKKIKQSNIYNGDTFLSYLTVNQDRIKYRNKSELRKNFSLNKNDFLILNIAINPYDQRKNIKTYIKIIKYFSNQKDFSENLKFIYVGGENPIKEKLHNYLFFQSNFDNEFMNKIYRLSDLYLDLSLSDNGPMSVFESYLNNTSVIISKKSLFSFDFMNLPNVSVINPKNTNEIMETIKVFLKKKDSKIENQFDYKNYNLIRALS